MRMHVAYIAISRKAFSYKTYLANTKLIRDKEKLNS